MNGRVFYTICSLNNISQAALMFDSVKGEGIEKILFLIDEKRDLDESVLDFEVIQVADTFKEHAELIEKYNPFEVCCALKPLAGKWLIENKKAEFIFYGDTDLYFYQPLESIVQLLGKKTILFNPHFTESPDDYEKISELDLNLTGLYNGGFYMFSSGEESKAMMEWWWSKTKEKGFNRSSEGMFVDQIWLNYFPLYFDNVHVEKHSGINMAYWNLHERKVQIEEIKKTVGDQDLIMYHFSGFRLHRPDLISIHQTRYSFENRPELLPLFKEYYDRWSTSDLLRFNDYDYTYDKRSKSKKTLEKSKKKLKKILKNDNPFR